MVCPFPNLQTKCLNIWVGLYNKLLLGLIIFNIISEFFGQDVLDVSRVVTINKPRMHGFMGLAF